MGEQVPLPCSLPQHCVDCPSQRLPRDLRRRDDLEVPERPRVVAAQLHALPAWGFRVRWAPRGSEGACASP